MGAPRRARLAGPPRSFRPRRRRRGADPATDICSAQGCEALYVDEGVERWSGVHREDAAALFRLVLERGTPGGIYHAVGDDGARFRDIAEAIGGGLNLPVRRKTLVEARRALGFFAPFVATDNPVSSALTQQRIGWKPQGPTLMQDFDHADYFGKARRNLLLNCIATRGVMTHKSLFNALPGVPNFRRSLMCPTVVRPRLPATTFAVSDDESMADSLEQSTITPQPEPAA